MLIQNMIYRVCLSITVQANEARSQLVQNVHVTLKSYATKHVLNSTCYTTIHVVSAEFETFRRPFCIHFGARITRGPVHSVIYSKLGF